MKFYNNTASDKAILAKVLDNSVNTNNLFSQDNSDASGSTTLMGDNVLSLIIP